MIQRIVPHLTLRAYAAMNTPENNTPINLKNPPTYTSSTEETKSRARGGSQSVKKIMSDQGIRRNNREGKRKRNEMIKERKIKEEEAKRRMDSFWFADVHKAENNKSSKA